MVALPSAQDMQDAIVHASSSNVMAFKRFVMGEVHHRRRHFVNVVYKGPFLLESL